MTQRQITHAAGSLPPCHCGRDPKHFEDLRAVGSGGGHQIECCPCDRRTSRFATSDAAVADWCRLVGRSVPEVLAIGRTRLLRQVRP